MPKPKRDDQPDDKPNATLREIADRLGLNVGTVSRALNGSDRVREETRALVVETAREMRYRPNKSARNLVRGKDANRFVAILMPNVVHQFFLGALKGLIDELDEASYNVMIFNLKGKRREVVERALDETPDGLLVFARELLEEERASIRARRIPFLYLDYLSERDPCVYFDNYGGGRIAAAHLLRRGVRAPLYVGLASPSQQQELRFRGFADAMAEGGVASFEARYIPHDEASAEAVAAEVLAAGKQDGLFFYCDELAYGGLRAMRRSGRRLPMLGYDDLSGSDLLGLTTVRQDAAAMGRAGARGIARLIEDELRREAGRDEAAGPDERLRLEPLLVERET